MVRVRIASLAVLVSLVLAVLSAHAQSYHSAQYPPAVSNPLGGRVQTSACALDRNPVNVTVGNSYLVGFNTLSLAETPQYPLLVGFDSSGRRTWNENPYLGSGSATAVVVDSQGYILVATTAGMVYGVAPPQPQQPQLPPAASGSFNLGGIATRMVLDAADNLYITGYTGNKAAIYVHRLNRTAEGYVPAPGWPQSVAGANATGNAIVVRNGSVYVAGTADRGLGTFGDGVALRFAGTGSAPQAQYWYDGTNGAGSGNDVFNDLAVDVNGNVYVTGTTDAMIDLPATDYVTARLNAGSLALGWARTFSGSELIKPRKTSIDSSLFLALDPFEQNVYVTGNAMNLGVGGIQTLKYSATGTLVGSSRTDNASVTGLFVSSAGQVFVGGVAGTSVLLLAHPSSLTGTILGTPAYVDMATLPNGLAGAAPTISCLLGRNISGNPALFAGGFYKITNPSGPPLQAIGIQWVNP